MKDRIISWMKLSRKCNKCGGDNADLSFTFATKHGEREECYHTVMCCPAELRQFQQRSETAMMREVMTPPGASSS